MEDKLLNEKQTEQENSEQKVHATLLRGHWRTVAVTGAFGSMRVIRS